MADIDPAANQDPSREKSRHGRPATAGGVAGPIKVFVATSVMLSFISFWRAAAIVLNDLGSSAYYVGGIAEQALGRAAPWFIFAIMVFSYGVRAVYVESCAMFTRGGVYPVVKQAMGGTLAKLSVSALMFDFILTGPISGVSAGQYIVGLLAQTSSHFGHPWNPAKEVINLWAAGLAAAVTIYFWWRNTRGLHESSEDALRIMYITTVMVVLLIGWCVFTFIERPATRRLPPSPVTQHLSFNRGAVGWLPDIAPRSLRELPAEKAHGAADSSPADLTPTGAGPVEKRYGLAQDAGMFLGLVGILMALGHSFLAMSGEESLAQVNRELEYPKHKNLMRAGFVIFVYSLVFTSLVSFFAYAIIPDDVRPQYFDNLISGIAMYLAGPTFLKLIFQVFIVVVGFLMLSGAVNTAIIGSNGVLNRVAEDGVLPEWLRDPHPKYGTTHRLINIVVILQLLTIIGSRGNVYVLGEAYAFGVIWSFSFNALAMIVLRFKDNSPRVWKVPLNIPLGNTEIPLGLGIITALLFSVAGINLITKQVATISGVAFTLVFFITFMLSERMNERHAHGAAHVEMDQFQLHPQKEVTDEAVEVRPGNSLCFVRDYHNVDHVRAALKMTDTSKKDVVVMSVKLLKGPDTGYEDLPQERLFSKNKQLLFTQVVAIAEKEGKPVHLLLVPSSNILEAIIHTAAKLHSAEVVVGASPVFPPEELARRFEAAWRKLSPSTPLCLRIIAADGKCSDFDMSGEQKQAA